MVNLWAIWKKVMVNCYWLGTWRWGSEICVLNKSPESNEQQSLRKEKEKKGKNFLLLTCYWQALFEIPFLGLHISLTTKQLPAPLGEAKCIQFTVKCFPIPLLVRRKITWRKKHLGSEVRQIWMDLCAAIYQ